MNILIDNCVDVRAIRLFSTGHAVVHVRTRGWRELRNGSLMARAAAESFDVFATTDKKIRHEHRLAGLPLSVLELNTLLTRLSDLEVLVPHLPRALELCRSYRFVSVRPDGTFECLAAIPSSPSEA